MITAAAAVVPDAALKPWVNTSTEQSVSLLAAEKAPNPLAQTDCQLVTGKHHRRHTYI